MFWIATYSPYYQKASFFERLSFHPKYIVFWADLPPDSHISNDRLHLIGNEYRMQTSSIFLCKKQKK